MVRLINLVVTCTKRKSATVPESLTFRRLPLSDVRDQAKLWRERLRSTAVESIPSRELYAGEYWSLVRSLENGGGGARFDVRLWIASAGYGLVSMDSPLKPYSATFSFTHPDSISGNILGDDRAAIHRNWWEYLSKAAELRKLGPRRIADVAADCPGAPLIIIASEPYLFAFGDDLRNSLKELRNPELLSIFSAGCKSLWGLDEQLLRYDARLQHTVGGTLRSLNVRIARLLLTQCKQETPSHTHFQRALDLLTRDAPLQPKYQRTVMSDAQIKEFVFVALASDPRAGHSPLLRKLRDQGRACEQKRFRALFLECREQFDAQ